MEKIELLSPVGSIEALYAAVENGADAVYLGGKLFNARQYASNFSNDELKDVIKYAHLNNVRVYVTVNTLLDDKEIEKAMEYIVFLYNINVDAIIVQDLGLACLTSSLLKDFEIHASTQMTINNYYGAKFLEDLGFKRVVLARELSLDEIKQIKNKTEIELEVFIHGALCICYSGQCLMSSIIGGRSGNRGRCAQPCRMPYSIIMKDNGQTIKGFEKKYLLSPKDLNTIDYLDSIVDAGISSLKIEGRMKRPEYVAIVVSKYKKALDIMNAKNNKLKISDRDRREIAQIFNRNFTKGYMFGDFGKKLISFDKPNNRGIYIGKIKKIKGNSMYALLEYSLNKGDGIEFINGTGQNIGYLVEHDIASDNNLNKYALVRFPKIKGVRKDALIYKTSDVKLLEKAQNSYQARGKNIKLGLSLEVFIRIGSPVQIHAYDDENQVTICSDEIVEAGLNVVLTKDKIIKQMNKLGNTPYFLEKIDIDLQEGSMVSISVLNDVRRRVVKSLIEKRISIKGREKIDTNIIKSQMNQIFLQKDNVKKDFARKLSIKVENHYQFNKLDMKKVDRVYLNFSQNIQECIKKAHDNGVEVYFATDKIISNNEFESIENVLNEIGVENIEGMSVSNLGTLKFAVEKYEGLKIHCDIGLNIFNKYSAYFLKNYGVESMTLSPELKLSQIREICSNSMGEFEVIGYGKLPLMVSRYCPLSLVKGCEDDKFCEKCELKEGFALKDRKGMIFDLVRKKGITTIYNNQPIFVLDYLEDIYSSGISMIRMDFTTEKNGIRELQNIYFNYAKGKINYKKAKEFTTYYKENHNITKGHFFRGVL